MDRQHIILSVLLTLPFLGIEVSPVGNSSWITSIIIWGLWFILLAFYNRRVIKKVIPVRIRSPFYISNGEKKAITSWLESALTDDRTHISDRIQILSVDYEFHISSTEPYIDILVKVKNCAIFPVQIIGVKGVLVIDGMPCLDSITSEDSFILQHFHWDTVQCRQPIRYETAQKLINYRDSNKEIHLNLSRCYLIVQSEEPASDQTLVNIKFGNQDNVRLLNL